MMRHFRRNKEWIHHSVAGWKSREHSNAPDCRMNNVQWEEGWREAGRRQTVQGFMGQLEDLDSFQWKNGESLKGSGQRVMWPELSFGKSSLVAMWGLVYRWGRPGQLHQLRDAAGISAKDDGGGCGWRALVQWLCAKALESISGIQSLPGILNNCVILDKLLLCTRFSSSVN